MNRIFRSMISRMFLIAIISLFFVGCSKSTSTLLEEGKTAFYAKEYVMAKDAFLECANRGDSQGQFWLAFLTYQLNGRYSSTDTLRMTKDKKDKYIFELYQKSANQNDGDGYFGLSTMYIMGFGVNKDEKLALEYLDKSVELGNLLAELITA